MRIDRLDLRDFGPFVGSKPLDLGGGARGLHLIQGPNEAGKSTALRAIRHLLFGFPRSTDDHHGRGYDALRLGATIRGEAGQALAFVRRKKEVKPLWTADDADPIDPDALAPFLAGVDAALFDDFFAMDHAELVAGGRSILKGGGRIGEMLFQAGSGLGSVDEVRRALEAEMDALFKPRASIPTINAALAELKDARAAADKAMLGTDRWVELDGKLNADRARLLAVEAERREADAEKRRLEALLKAVPVIARLDAAASALASLADVPVLADGFADRRRDATAALAVATRAGGDAARAIDEVDRLLESLGPPDPIAAEGDAVRRLRDDLGLYRKAARERPGAFEDLARLEADALALLAEIRPGATLDEAESLRVPASRRESIRALGEEAARLDLTRTTAGAEVARLDRPDAIAPTPDAPRLADALAHALARWQVGGDPEAQHSEAVAELESDASQAAVALRALPLWSGSIGDLEALKLPSTATLDRFEAGFAAGDAEVKLARKDLAKAEAERLALAREIARADAAGLAPTEEDLTARRLVRDDAWRTIRRSWLGGEVAGQAGMPAPPDPADGVPTIPPAPVIAGQAGMPAPPGPADGVPTIPPAPVIAGQAGMPAPPDPAKPDGGSTSDGGAGIPACLDPESPSPPDPARLAASFEAAVLAADAAADRLRREADLVAEQAQRLLKLRDLGDRVGLLESGLAARVAAREAIGREWLDLWLAVGLDPLPPREMKDWTLQGRADLVRRAQSLREGRARVDRLAARVEEARAEIAAPMLALGEPPAAPGESLAALRGRAGSAVARVAASLDLDRARSALAKADADRGAWRLRWLDAVAPLGLAAESAPAEAHAALARLDELGGMLRQVRDLNAAIAEQARVEARFEADLRALLARLKSPDHPPVGQAFLPAQQHEVQAGMPAPPETRQGPHQSGNDPDPAVEPESAARELSARFDRSAVAEARREEFRRRRLEEQAGFAEYRLDLDRAVAALAALVAEAGCGEPDYLLGAERASDDARAARLAVRTLEDQLATLAGGSPVAALIADAAGSDAPTLEIRIAALSDRLAPLEARSRDLGVEIGRSLQQLDAMDGGPAAADARQDLEGRIARLAGDVERYARLRIAAAILRDAVERHREKHQGPVLARAGAHFATLTAGSFAGLRADLDDKGDPVLRGLRADGTTLLGAEAMSEGTADQLYLALRLASLEVYLDDHPPLPLVLDDILVNFDDARARAALGVLSELSKKTQILFFTHHDHLVDLAKSSLSEDELFIHRLTFPPERVELPEAEAIEAKPKRRKKAIAGES